MLQNLYVENKISHYSHSWFFFFKEIPSFHPSQQAWQGKGVLFLAEKTFPMPATAGVNNTKSNMLGWAKPAV